MAGKTSDYQLTINGLHIYNKVETDESVLLKYSSEGVSNNTWSNGLYSLSPIGDGWNNSGFKMKGGSAKLYFPIWNLEYSKKYTFTIAAGAAKDNYGNSNTEAINIEVEVGDKPKVEAAVYDYVVPTAEEFSAAIVAVNETNKQKDAARKVIFVKNGDYDFGSTEQNLKAYNVSIIGESMDGVLLHGLRSDISNPILQINNTGGKQAVFKHIAMQSQQDTQVTGESGYITAPATSPLLKWGYVFQGCTINGYKGSYTYTSGYTLGRPWQNEPRCYVIFKDGAYLTNQTSTAYVATEQGTYTVRSANRNGGLCGTSNAVTVSDSKFDDSSTGILSPSIEIGEEAVPLFNLAGQRVGKDYRGIIVKNGKKFVKK